MSGKKKQLFRSWFCRIEHEIMLPFVTVGILVVCAFCAISVYNGYTEKLKDRKEYARTTIRGMEADIYYLQGKLSEDEIRQKYNFYYDPAVRIMAADGTVITGDEEIPDGNMELLYADSGNSLGWRLEYWMDKKSFENAILEEQNYVIVGAVASLLVIVQVSVFLAWSLTKPIRSMGAACKKLDENKDGFREYSFPETARKDEIGQLARTFESRRGEKTGSPDRICRRLHIHCDRHADPGTVVLSVSGPDTGDPHNGGPGDPAVFPLLLSQ